MRRFLRHDAQQPLSGLTDHCGLTPDARCNAVMHRCVTFLGGVAARLHDVSIRRWRCSG
jgi:hypothetical protein